ncbi:MAG: HAMP domain-containing protein, partial [Woeseiaceae bacterium]|nr:HAMP domain-containing protein [Woeseiaceae bacterium]
MNKLFSFPIRLKVLVAVLVILMLVVGVITATMANLFHQDKTAYVRDFSVAVTSNMRAEVETILASHLSAAGVLAEVLLAEYMEPATKQQLVKPIFIAYPGLLALVTTSAGEEPLSLYNSATLRDAGIEPDELYKLPSLTSPREEGTVRVRGALNDNGTGAVTLTLGHRLPGGEKDSPVVAIVSPADLSQVLRRGRPFDSVLLDPDWQPVVAMGDTDNAVAWARLALESFEGVGTSGAFEYSADGHDYIAAVAKTSIGDLTIITRISATAAYMTASQLLDDLVFVGLVIILVAAICGDIASRRITRPLERLSNAVRKIAKGDFDVNVAIKSSDEIGELSTSFNNMAAELKEREASLKKAQHALIQSEKMAAVGTLSAGLAHEVKNPLSAVLGYAQLSKRKLTEPDALKGYLDTIENETRRCNEIIGNLMQFSRQEKGEHSQIFVNDVVSKSAAIVDHQLSLAKVHVSFELGENIPAISGNANQLQQVLMNLMINAQQAMGDGGGKVDIVTFVNGESVMITVLDTGPGIDEDVAAKIFEPFFTTK